MIGTTIPRTALLRAGVLVALLSLGAAAASSAENSKDSFRRPPTRTRTPTQTIAPTRTLTSTSTPVPTDTATPLPTDTATPLPTNTATPLPTDTATPVPTSTPTPVLTTTPTRAGTNTPVRTPTESGGQINIISLHDSASSRYDKNCTSCHADVLSETSLDPSIAAIHVAMRPYAPGRGNTQCIWCHRTVDLVQGVQSEAKSKATLRKLVDPAVCSVCHLPGGPATQLYQTGPSRTNPDGAQLYELVCAACHGNLANSEVRGESASEIWTKIDGNEGGMGPLGVLSTQQVQAIADALAR